METATTSNFKQYTEEELDTKLASLMNETTIEEDIKELHNFGKTIPARKIDGVITEEYREWVKESVELTKEFKAKWGKRCLITFNLYTTLKTRLQNVPNCLDNSRFKLSNSKGNGYGNM